MLVSLDPVVTLDPIRFLTELVDVLKLLLSNVVSTLLVSTEDVTVSCAMSWITGCDITSASLWLVDTREAKGGAIDVDGREGRRVVASLR